MPGYILTNASFWTPPGKQFEALAVLRGVVEAAGTQTSLEEFGSRYGYRVVDLEGRTAVPGLIDAHIHLASLAKAREAYIDLHSARSIEELKKLVKRGVEGREGWVLGRGWDQERLEERRPPTRWDLDPVTGDRPVLLYRVCGHVAVANTAALRLTGLLEDPGRVPGVDLDEQGRPTGILREAAAEYVARKAPEPGPETLARYLEKTLRSLAEFGVTGVHTVYARRTEILALQRVGHIARVRIYVEPGLAGPLEALGLEAGFGDQWLKIMGVKVLTDGSLGARTAALREPYNDDPSTRGVMNYSDDAIFDLMLLVRETRLQGSFHAIGDRALEAVLRIAEKIGVSGPALRVEHASLAPPDLREKMTSVKPVVVVQPQFVLSDTWIIERLGERAKHAYPFRSLLKAGLLLAASSDAPVEEPNPWMGVYAAVARGEPEGLPLSRLTPGERLSVEEALTMYTSGSAAASLDKGFLGCLEPGCAADIAVLNRDPFKTSINGLKEVRSVVTLVAGRAVHVDRDTRLAVRLEELGLTVR